MVKILVGFILMIPFVAIMSLPYDSPIIVMLDVAMPVLGLVIGGPLLFMGLIQILVPNPGLGRRGYASRNDLARIRFEVENRSRNSY